MSFETVFGSLLPVMLAFAEDSAVVDGATLGRLWTHILAAVTFALIGIAVLALCFKLMAILSPFCVKKEIEEDQNVAVAIIMGSVVIGISIIIAAAILG